MKSSIHSPRLSVPGDTSTAAAEPAIPFPCSGDWPRGAFVRLAIATAALCFPEVAASAEPMPTERQIIDYMQTGTPAILRLWPADSPRNQSRNGKPESAKLRDKLRVYDIEKPSLLVYSPPEGVTKLDAAVIHCPGGGYNYLAMDNPRQLTTWLNHLGITVAVLKYHAPRSKDDPLHLGPLADAQRALRLLRSRAGEFGLSPDKIGISGASAGGHLGFNACLNQGKPVYEAIDAIDRQSCRPAFGLLFYAAYLSKPGKEVTLDPSLDPALLGKDTPPVFMTINGDDWGFAMGNLAAMAAMHDHQVPAELHIWTKGGHSGCFDKYPLAEFARPAARFLVRRGVLPKAALARSDAWLDEVVAKLRKQPRTTHAPDANPPEGLADAGLTMIDREIHKAAGRDLRTYRLWPGDGTRSDDPDNAGEETLENRNVPFASDVTVPTMTWFPAEKPTGRGVLVFPGGGYGGLAWDHEGLKVAEWLNGQGLHAFLVKYRTPRRQGLDKHHVALQDARQAIRLVRSQAQAFGVDPEKVGVLGFSAGGHLAALVGAASEGQSDEPIDDHDAVSPVADFRILIYPAYTTTAIDNNELDPLLLRKFPAGPTFVATAADDKHTRGQYFFVGSQLLAKTPLAYHVYENGGHGKGILDTPSAFSQWPRECARWLSDLDR